MIVLVGFIGKVLGSAAMLYLVVTGTWPWKAMWLCVTNDLIWLVPFAMYLYDSRRGISDR
jgi:hypothetical protein